jgi:16S rRNA (adenine1518-N6/adenine1519-N6)-dimethyltransferase
MYNRVCLSYFKNNQCNMARRWGQHFLNNADVARNVVDTAHLKLSDTCVEIGAGYGALTQWLAQRTFNLTAIEIDPHCVQTLRLKFPNVTVLHQDILLLDMNTFPDVRWFGNLPYNLSTTLIMRIIQTVFKDAYFMVQAEVAQRLCACPSTSAYSGLSVLFGQRAHATLLNHVEPSCFTPPPKVLSAVVHMTPAVKHVACHACFTALVKHVFLQRRKQLYNSMATYRTILNNSDRHKRAEDLSIVEWIAYADTWHQYHCKAQSNE